MGFKKLVVFRKLDQDRRSISDYADPGLRLRKHFISERWIEPIADQSILDRAIQDWGNPGLMFSQNLAFRNPICWVTDIRPSVVMVQLHDCVLLGLRSRFHFCNSMRVYFILYLFSFKIKREQYSIDFFLMFGLSNQHKR